MPNFNYQAGRRFEYARRKFYTRQGFHAMRTSGSHGAFDIICVKDDYPVILIQCKRTISQAVAKALLKKFKEDPPLASSKHYYQKMEVQVKGAKEVISVTV